jgi:glycosyltransferase involved in cell wall biosynthesis
MAIECLILNPELRNNLGKAGRARVLGHYNLEANVGRLAKIFSGRLVSHEISSNTAVPA